MQPLTCRNPLQKMIYSTYSILHEAKSLLEIVTHQSCFHLTSEMQKAEIHVLKIHLKTGGFSWCGLHKMEVYALCFCLCRVGCPSNIQTAMRTPQRPSVPVLDPAFTAAALWKHLILSSKRLEVQNIKKKGKSQNTKTTQEFQGIERKQLDADN